MANNFKFIDNHIELDKAPGKPKKLTATRFATVLGLNAWSTPFGAWCEITRTYEDPFEDSIYTVGGKIIEPKIAKYLEDRYFMDITTPTDVYGADYFKKTYGDFFPDVKAFGGMWDYLVDDDGVVEVKTTKRVEDWKGPNGEVEPPIYYKLQACLYAYLMGRDRVVMTCSFLEDKDYPIQNGKDFDTTPTEAFKPGVDNTVVIEFSLSEAFPNFKEEYVDRAMDFWTRYVETGISPDYDEKKDAEILKVLRKNIVETDDDLTKLLKEADKLRESVDKAEARIQAKKDRLKEIEEAVKKALAPQFRDGDKKVEVGTNKYTWTLSKVVSNRFDSTKFKKDNPELHAQYTKESTSYRLNVTVKD